MWAPEPSGEELRRHYTEAVRSIERGDCVDLIRLALVEDAPVGDPTSEAIFSPTDSGRAQIVAKEAGVLCGLALLPFLIEEDHLRWIARSPLESMQQKQRSESVQKREQLGQLEQLEQEQKPERSPLAQQQLQFSSDRRDGDRFSAGDELVHLKGDMRAILRLERIMLNFLQYLSGISTATAHAVQSAGDAITILDTRKTLPGYRRLAKYAVYCGGGTNHRIHLGDMAMIKDNHIAAAGSLTVAVERLRSKFPQLPLNLEVASLEQLEEALPLRTDIILLDNMKKEQIETACQRINSYYSDEGKKAGAKKPQIEISGNWKRERLSQLQGLGPIAVSMGYLTHSAPFLDMSMEIH